jgi:putative DNA primase/helicase
MDNLDLSNLTPEQLSVLAEQVAQAKAQLQLVLPDTTGRGQGRPTLNNTDAVLRHYGIRVRHNEMTKEMDIDIPNTHFNTDTAQNAKLAHIKILARQHELNPSDIFEHLTRIANANSYHPVRDWIDSLQWDGRDRLADYYESVNLVHDNPMKQVMMRKWALSLVAALYHPNFSCEGVLTFSGEQGQGKTIWVEELIPRQYHNVWNKDAVIIDTKNKDTISKALGYWITELGEIDATFRRTDIEALKAFITEKVDVIRPPYERTANKYPRRTVFYATVNEQEFLQDTQNRRFWVLEVASFDLGRIDPAQFWAQMRQEYLQVAGQIGSGADRKRNGEWGWFMSPQERAQMQVLQETHKAVDPVEETMASRIITNVLARQAKSGLTESLNVTEILRRCGQYPINRRETNIGARWLRRNGFKPNRQKQYDVLILAPDTAWNYGGSARSGVNSGRDSD